MPQWLKNLVMIVGLGGWLAVVVVRLASHELPDAIMLGIPAGLVLALSPPGTGRRERQRREDEIDRQ
jgi:hypothetical protein